MSIYIFSFFEFFQVNKKDVVYKHQPLSLVLCSIKQFKTIIKHTKI